MGSLVSKRPAELVEYHAKLLQLAATIDLSGAPDPTTLEHYFAHGTYMRVMHLPADTVIVGRIHKHSTVNIITKGRISFTLGDGSTKTVEAPAYFVSDPGVQKAGYAHEDTTWINVFPNETEERDIDTLVQMLSYPSLEALEADERLMIEEL